MELTLSKRLARRLNIDWLWWQLMPGMIRAGWRGRGLRSLPGAFTFVWHTTFPRRRDETRLAICKLLMRTWYEDADAPEPGGPPPARPGVRDRLRDELIFLWLIVWGLAAHWRRLPRLVFRLMARRLEQRGRR